MGEPSTEICAWVLREVKTMYRKGDKKSASRARASKVVKMALKVFFVFIFIVAISSCSKYYCESEA
jgi:hypothetical protein